MTVGRRQLEARGASRDLDTWKWTRDDGGDDAGDGDSDDDLPYNNQVIKH